MKLYIVQGCNGDYSAPIIWLVAAYSDEELAKQHCELANDYWNHRPEYSKNPEAYRKWFDLNPYDKFTNQEDYPTQDYEVLEVDLFRHVDEYQELK